MRTTRRDTLRLSLLASVGSLAGTLPLRAFGAEPAGVRRWGVNPTGPTRYGGQWLLGNLATHADETSLRRFSVEDVAAFSTGTPLTLSTGEQLYAIADNGGLTPGGAWTVTWQGAGSCSLRVFNGTATPAGEGPGTRTFQLSPAATHVFVVADRSDPTDPVRGVGLWHDDSNPRHAAINPAAAETLRGVHSIRCMDWGHTNGNPVVEWADRTLPGASMQAGSHGTALELQLALVQAANAEVWWLCVPPKASIAYSRELGRWLSEKVPAGVEVKVEYGNEVWNTPGPFSVFHLYVLSLPDLADPRQPGRTTNHFAVKYGDRAARHLAAVREAFPRAGFVMGAQTVNPWIAETATMAAVAAGQTPDFVALTGYFDDGFDVKLGTGEVDIDGFFTGLATRLKDPARWDTFREHGEIAKRFGAELVMYEGGTHCLPRAGGLEALKAVHRDPRFAGLARLNTEGWFKNTDTAEYMHFGDAYRMGQHGFWGFCESNLTLEGRPTDVAADPRLAGVLAAVKAR